MNGRVLGAASGRPTGRAVVAMRAADGVCAKMHEDLVDHRRLRDERHEAHHAVAGRAREEIPGAGARPPGVRLTTPRRSHLRYQNPSPPHATHCHVRRTVTCAEQPHTTTFARFADPGSC